MTDSQTDANAPDPSLPVQGAAGPVSATAKGRTVTYRFANGSTFTKHGSHPNRDNNPLDLETGPITARHGAIGKDKGFGIFPSAEVGLTAAVANMDRMNNGAPFLGKAKLSDLISKWSPPKENNTARMIREIPAAAGLKANDLWYLLTPIKKQDFIKAYAKAEGFSQ